MDSKGNHGERAESLEQVQIVGHHDAAGVRRPNHAQALLIRIALMVQDEEPRPGFLRGACHVGGGRVKGSIVRARVGGEPAFVDEDVTAIALASDFRGKGCISGKHERKRAGRRTAAPVIRERPRRQNQLRISQRVIRVRVREEDARISDELGKLNHL